MNYGEFFFTGIEDHTVLPAPFVYIGLAFMHGCVDGSGVSVSWKRPFAGKVVCEEGLCKAGTADNRSYIGEVNIPAWRPGQLDAR